MMLLLSSDLEKTIRIDGEKAYPNECCGVLIGEISETGVKTAKRAETIHNAREDGEQYHRFLITPDDIFRIEQSLRAVKLEPQPGAQREGSPLDIIGFYHSHPDHPAAPSDYDREHALPFYSYVIVSVKQGTSKELTSWELTEDRTGFLPEELKEKSHD